MMNAAAGIFLAARRKPRLPYDAEVEYLESTGTQWIDTGYTSNHRDEVITAVINNHKDTNVLQPIFGSWGSSADYRSQLYKTTGRIGGNYVNFLVPGNKVVSVVADFPGLRFVIDGRQYASSGMTAPAIDSSLLIFKRQIDTTRGVFRLYGLYITRSANRVMDLAPVRFTNEQGVSEGAMYDRVNPTVGMNPDGSARTDGLYRNRGTGAFTIGPDK